MRPIHLVPITAVLLLFGGESSAQTVDECRLKCAADRDSNNATCPAAEDYAGATDARQQCLKRNQDTYFDCVRGCPPLESGPAPSGPQIAPPAPMGY